MSTSFNSAPTQVRRDEIRDVQTDSGSPCCGFPRISNVGTGLLKAAEIAPATLEA